QKRQAMLTFGHLCLNFRFDLNLSEPCGFRSIVKTISYEIFGSLFLVAEPPFEVVFVAAFLLFVRGLFGAEHLFSSFEKVLLGEGQAAALTRVLLDCRVIT